MGLTVLELEIANPATPDVGEKVEFLIDSGAISSVVRAPVLERLGIRPLSQEEFRLANGSKIVRKKGVAVFRHRERVGGADVIFGEEADNNRRYDLGISRPLARPTAARVGALADDSCLRSEMRIAAYCPLPTAYFKPGRL